MPKDSDNVQALAEPSSLDLLNSVSVKVPAFWPDSAEAWFVQVEAQFALKGVTASSTKFYYCVSSFNQERRIKFWILSRILRLQTPTKPWRTVYWDCLLSTIIKGMKQSLTFLSPATWNLQSLCRICSPCFLLVTNRASFSVELFWRGCPPTSELTCWGTIFRIL